MGLLLNPLSSLLYLNVGCTMRTFMIVNLTFSFAKKKCTSRLPRWILIIEMEIASSYPPPSFLAKNPHKVIEALKSFFAFPS